MQINRADPFAAANSREGVIDSGESAEAGLNGRSFSTLPSGRRTVVSDEAADTGNQTELRSRRITKVNYSRPYVAMDSSVRLNGTVAVRTVDKNELQPVTCCSFAERFVSQPAKARATRELMRKLSSSKLIKEEFSKTQYSKLSSDNLYGLKVANASPNSKHLLSANRLGEYLESLASSIPIGKKNPYSVRNFLLTDTHAMAINVQSKSKQGVDYFAVTLYDPTVTNNNMRIEVPDAQSLRKLTLKDMMVEPSDAQWYGGRIKNDYPMVAVCMDPALKLDYRRDQMPPTPDNMNVAVSYGSAIDVKVLLDAAKNQPPPKPSLFSKVTGSQAITSNDVTYSLLAAKNKRGIPGLSMAITNCHPVTVGLLVRAVLMSDLPDDDKFPLLQAAAPPEVDSGIQQAMAQGTISVVKEFVGAVLESDSLGGSQKAAIIRGEAPPGVSGLASAMRRGDRKMVATYTNTVLNSNLRDSSKYRILSASRLAAKNDLEPLKGGSRIKAQFAFSQAVLNSKLPDNMKVSLLEAHKADVGTILMEAYSIGSTLRVQAFTSMITNSNLSPADKFLLLDMRDNENNPVSAHALDVSFSNGTVDAFINLVSNSNISSDNKRTLTQGLLPPGFTEP